MPVAQPTIRDVASRAGTSTAVVSYVLNDGPRSVAASTRERVLRAVDELGYRRNNLARALRAGRSGTVGLVVPDLAKPFFAELAKAIEDAAFARGLRLLVGSTHFTASREHDQVNALVDARVDAVLLVPADDPAPGVELLRGGRVPHIILHREQPGSRCVCGDDLHAGRLAAEHLLAHGHQTVALLGAPGPDTPVQRRAEGARTVLAEAGRAPSPDIVLTCPFRGLRQQAYRACRELLAARPDVTAVCATTDEHALGAVRAASETGRVVGRDLAVISIDGTEQTAYLTPPLTTVALNFRSIADDAVSQLIDGDPGATSISRHPLTLVKRRSCGCMPLA